MAVQHCKSVLFLSMEVTYTLWKQNYVLSAEMTPKAKSNYFFFSFKYLFTLKNFAEHAWTRGLGFVFYIGTGALPPLPS